MSDLSVHFSSATPQWGTPQAFFDKLDAEFNFQTDVCAEEWNAKCARYFTPEMDGLKQEWTGMCWMNPPYGREIGKWVKKAYDSACEGSATVVCLLPARIDTRWWWDYAIAGEIRPQRGRLKFVSIDKRCNPAPFPSAIVIFHAHLDPGGIVKWIPNFRGSNVPDPATRGVGTARDKENCLVKGGGSYGE